MKTIVLALSLILFLSCQQEKEAPSENSDEAIIEVVTGETYAYMKKDYQKWASYWDHSEQVLRLDVADGAFSQTRGWNRNGGHLESFFKEYPEPITSTFENSNYLIFHEANLSWVAFDQKWTTQEGETSVAKATITLIKKEKAWKIISYTAILYEEGESVDTLGRD